MKIEELWNSVDFIPKDLIHSELTIVQFSFTQAFLI